MQITNENLNYEVREHHVTQNDADIHSELSKMGIILGRTPLVWTNELEQKIYAYLKKKKEIVIKALDGKSIHGVDITVQYYGIDLDPFDDYVKDELNLIKYLLTAPSNSMVLINNLPDMRCKLCRFKHQGRDFAQHCLERDVDKMELIDIRRYMMPVLSKLDLPFNIEKDMPKLIEISMRMDDYRELISKYWDVVEL